MSLVHLPEGLDWFYRPMTAGWLKYESYKDGTIDLSDIADLNEVLDARDENRERLRQEVERLRGQK